MILFAEEYHTSQIETHRPYMLAFAQRFNRLKLDGLKKKRPWKATTGQEEYVMQKVEVRAIRVAHRLVRLLGLDLDGEYSFRPLPWMDPGERIEITENTVSILQKLL